MRRTQRLAGAVVAEVGAARDDAALDAAALDEVDGAEDVVRAVGVEGADAELPDAELAAGVEAAPPDEQPATATAVTPARAAARRTDR